MNNIKKRLIEISLPLAAISKQSAREKSIRHGHISTLHIWWARRPLAAMRAAIFASLIPAPESDEERQKLERLIETIVDWDQVKDGNSPAIEQARDLIRQAFPDGPPRLLDPFMGGGATGLEALRLGCETHAVELNPVAHLIELCTLVYPQKYGRGAGEQRSRGDKSKQKTLPGHEQPEQLEMFTHPSSFSPQPSLAADVRHWGEWVLEQAKAEIGHLYENPAGDETIVGYLWARTVICPNPACRAEMPLVRQWWLAQTGKRKITLKPVVDHAAKRINFEVVDLAAQRTKSGDFDPNQGTTSRGNATCLVCGQVADVEYIRQEGLAGRMTETPLAVIYEQAQGGKGYRPFTLQDIALFGQAKELLAGMADQPPDEPLPPVGTLGFRVQRYGLTRWGDLFNARQALALLTFSQQVRAAYEAMLAEGMDSERAKAIVTYLGLNVDRLAFYCSTLCAWHVTGEKMQPTMMGQRLAMVWDFTEVNPFSSSTGNWFGALEWIIRVIEHATETGFQSAETRQGTSTRLPQPAGYFDTVVTDPPYYDAVPYADLSDFFYVWLKRSIGFLYPDLFRTPLTPKSTEIIQEPSRHESDEVAKAFYEREMTRAFSEACRVLKPDGIFVVVFAHKSTSAWETLLNSLLEAGLVVTASWPLHTEMGSRLRARESAALASSIFIVCRVRTTETEGYFDDVREELAATIRERLDFFWQQGIRGADFFISAIGPAVSVFGRYRHVYRLDSSEVGVRELLDLVQASVAEYALDRILNGGAARVGGVDAATRYYILHRWAYGSEAIPFDDAMRLAMALGSDVSTLMERRGLLQQGGETVTLVGPKQRGKIEELGLPDRSGRQAGVIDVLHRAAVLWEKGDRDGLARFLAEAAAGREEQVRLVAQTIINILPDDDPERRLLEGFLQGRDGLPDVPRQQRLL
jgi:putative DNA methylase